jgi:pyridoxal phosphate enzyme (YggS family)
MEIAEKIGSVRKRIEAAALRVGRNPGDIRLVAVTKFAEPGQIISAIDCGIRIIGENRLQEALAKFGKIPAHILEKAEKHFIGTLQGNKVRAVVKNFDAIQSVDSVKLAKEINDECVKINRIMPVFVEINIGEEETKHGVSPEKAPAFCNSITKFTGIRLAGLMCIAPYSENAEDARPYFRRMRELNSKIGAKWLSMGMSNDFEVAVEEGSSMVRIGMAIFGEQDRDKDAK